MQKRVLDPNKLWVGDIVLVATKDKIVEYVQRKLNYSESSRWTHVAGCIGAYDLIEGQPPKSRVCSLQKDYVDKDFEIKVLRRVWENDNDRIKVALWWATMNNLRYDFVQLLWFVLGIFEKTFLLVKNMLNSNTKLICSELITDGFLKQGYNLFDKPAANVLPADFDNAPCFKVVEDIWLK